MNKLSIGTIFVSKSNFEAINEMLYKTKLENFSKVVDEIVFQYLNLIPRHQDTVKKIQELNRENTELREVVKKYRNNIIDTDYLPKVGDK